MLYRSHLRPPSNNLSRAFGLSLLLSAHQRRRRWRIWLLGEKDREREKETKAGRGGGGEGKERGRGRRERKRPVGAVRAFGTRNPRRKGRNVLSTLHVGAQTNRGTRSLFLSGGCGGGGTKSLRLPPPPSLASLSISVYLSFSPTAFFPHFPLRLSHRQSLPLSLARRRRRRCRLPLSLYPFATAVLLTLFSLLATPLFMPPHSPGLRPCLALASRRLSFSSFLSIILPPAPELNHLRRFFADTACRPSSSSMCKPIAHASKRAGRSEP